MRAEALEQGAEGMGLGAGCRERSEVFLKNIPEYPLLNNQPL